MRLACDRMGVCMGLACDMRAARCMRPLEGGACGAGPAFEKPDRKSGVQYMAKLAELRKTAEEASMLDEVCWTRQVEGAISMFKSETAPVYTNQMVPVAYYKEETTGLTMLHLLAQACPPNRECQFRRLLHVHGIDKISNQIHMVLEKAMGERY